MLPIISLPRRKGAVRRPGWSPAGAAPRPAPYGGSGPRAAHRDLVDAQRRLADAHRDALTVLAAGADAVVEGEVVADHADAVQVGRAVADQHRALHRRADLAVIDAVGLGALKDVLARRDVDLAAAKAHRVDALLHRRDDLRRLASAGQHVGVGHARHRHVAVA